MKYFITGCSRGIGREMAIKLLSTGATVIATARTLSSLSDMTPDNTPSAKNLLRLALDVDSEDSISAALAVLNSRPEFWPVDVLVNNAGVLFAESTFGSTREAFRRSFETNAISPFLFTLKVAERFLAPGAKVVFVSSRMGSIEDNSSSSLVAYRAKKYKDCCVIALHPGWVKTDMGYKAGGEPPLETAESVQRMIRVIEALDLSQNGMFLSYKNDEIPW